VHQAVSQYGEMAKQKVENPDTRQKVTKGLRRVSDRHLRVYHAAQLSQSIRRLSIEEEQLQCSMRITPRHAKSSFSSPIILAQARLNCQKTVTAAQSSQPQYPYGTYIGMGTKNFLRKIDYIDYT
jgi:hypothetical protein